MNDVTHGGLVRTAQGVNRQRVELDGVVRADVRVALDGGLVEARRRGRVRACHVDLGGRVREKPRSVVRSRSCGEAKRSQKVMTAPLTRSDHTIVYAHQLRCIQQQGQP